METPGEIMNILIKRGDRILSYKVMLSAVLKILARKAADKNTKKILMDLSEQERADSEHWKTSLETFLESPIKQPSRSINFQIRIMAGILGIKGFLKWILIAEDEALEELMIWASTQDENSKSNNLTRIFTDEHLHVIQMKEDLLGMKVWEMGESGGIRDVIFGANDGLVSILALVAGVYGAVTDNRLILITGIAGAVAGTISMGAGAYLSAKSEKEVKQKENNRKGIKSGSQDETRQNLVELYQSEGMSKKEAEAVADRVQKKILTESTHRIGEVAGLTSEDEWPPSKAGLLTGISFLLASVVPILPFAFLEGPSGALVAMVASIIALFAVGASKAVFTRSSWIKSGLENLVIGILAATATYLIGILIPGI